jgi:nitrogen-specific signal transduction histidine kinase
MVNEDIDRTDSEIDCFLEYMKIKSPVPKANTVHNLLEALLVVHEKKLKDKKIKIAKKQYDRDLPETSVADEQLRYILNWILQYAILATAPNGNLGIFTKSLDSQDARDEGKTWGTRVGRYMEILVVFNGWEKTAEQSGTPQELQAVAKQNGKNLILPFVEEIVQENRGMMRFKGDAEKHISQISLVLPVERRKVSCYQLAES